MAKTTGLPAHAKAEAIALLADGATVEQIADRFDVSPQTIRAWRKNPAIQEEYRREIMGRGLTSFARAFTEMDRELDSDMPWIRQGAARDIMNRFQELVTGQSSQDIVIRLEGMPQLGIPGADSAGDSDIEPIDGDIA
jgi:hypothetical protein